MNNPKPRASAARRALLAAAGAACVLTLATGCGETGKVQAKSMHTTYGLPVYQYCLGDSRATCKWATDTDKFAVVGYRNCRIGDDYPHCKGWPN
jgi:hypothetical protein